MRGELTIQDLSVRFQAFVKVFMTLCDFVYMSEVLAQRQPSQHGKESLIIFRHHFQTGKISCEVHRWQNPSICSDIVPRMVDHVARHQAPGRHGSRTNGLAGDAEGRE